MVMTRATLKGRRIAVLAADGFDKVELTIPVAALRMAGAEVKVISLRHGRIRGVNLREPASRVRVNKMIEEANPADYDGLFIPGALSVRTPASVRQGAGIRSNL
jgi:protease I